MTTSGTAEFDLDLNSLIEEAFERCGAELRTGYDFRIHTDQNLQRFENLKVEL